MRAAIGLTRERLGRLRRFLAPQVAELLVSADGEALLESHRRQIAVVCCQLPEFAALADSTAPEEVLAVLRAYHEGLGSVIYGFEGTVQARRAAVELFADPEALAQLGRDLAELAQRVDAPYPVDVPLRREPEAN